MQKMGQYDMGGTTWLWKLLALHVCGVSWEVLLSPMADHIGHCWNPNPYIHIIADYLHNLRLLLVESLNQLLGRDREAQKQSSVWAFFPLSSFLGSHFDSITLVRSIPIYNPYELLSVWKIFLSIFVLRNKNAVRHHGIVFTTPSLVLNTWLSNYLLQGFLMGIKWHF